MKFAWLFVLIFSGLSFAQQTFFIENASKKYDIKIEVEKCEDGFCKAKADFSIYRKNNKKPFQVIHLKETYIPIYENGRLHENGRPEIAKIEEKKDGKWSSIYLEDFNFDGTEDLAIPDGDYGGYRGTSYRVYLYSKRVQKFIFSRSFTRLVQGPYLGIFLIDRKKGILQAAWKSSCCMHFREYYRVFENRPRKVRSISEYYNALQDGFIDIETEILINGKWRRWHKRKKIEEIDNEPLKTN